MNMVANIMLYTKGVWGFDPRSQRMFDAKGELKSPQRLERTDMDLSTDHSLYLITDYY